MGLCNIEITQSTRDLVLQALSSGKNHVQIGQITIMLNAIRGIEPLEVALWMQEERENETR
jgi:hypothetical protein